MDIIKMLPLKFNERQVRIVVFIILLFSFSIPLFMFKGSIDDFIPKHIAVIDEIIYRGYMPENNFTNALPGFYIFGAIITILSGIPINELSWFPIQIVPYVIIFFTLMYKISGNYLIAGLVTLLDVISGTTGSVRVFFWPHGLGYILFYLFICMLMDLTGELSEVNKNLKKIYGRFIIIITCSSLVFISYNLTGMCLLLILITATIIYLQSITTINIEDKIKGISLSKSFYTLLSIIGVIELGLSKFFYNTFIPTIKASEFIELSSIEKFILYYISPKSVDTIVADLYLKFPISISVVSGIKYFLLLSVIIICLILIISKIWKKVKLNYIDITVLATVIMMFCYSLFRMALGGIVITSLYLPGLFCALWIFRFSNKLKQYSVIMLTIILVLVPLYYYINFSNNLINKSLESYEKIIPAGDWLAEKGSVNYQARSDELTRNLLVLDQSVKTKRYDDAFIQNKTMTTIDAAALIGRSVKTPQNKYFVLNYELNSLSLENWITIRSWRFTEDLIENKSMLNKNYDNKSVAIYSSL